MAIDNTQQQADPTQNVQQPERRGLIQNEQQPPEEAVEGYESQTCAQSQEEARWW